MRILVSDILLNFDVHYGPEYFVFCGSSCPYVFVFHMNLVRVDSISACNVCSSFLKVLAICVLFHTSIRIGFLQTAGPAEKFKTLSTNVWGELVFSVMAAVWFCEKSA